MKIFFNIFSVSPSEKILAKFTIINNQDFQTELADMTSPEATMLPNNITEAVNKACFYGKVENHSFVRVACIFLHKKSL